MKIDYRTAVTLEIATIKAAIGLLALYVGLPFMGGLFVASGLILFGFGVALLLTS